MNTERVFGPTFPDQEVNVSDLDIKSTVSEIEIDQYKAELSVCETIGPLLPGYEVLEEVRHIKNKDDDSDKLTYTPHSWMSDKLPPSKIDPMKSLKSRGFCMNSQEYLDFSVPTVADDKRDTRESLMDIHRRSMLPPDDANLSKPISKNRSRSASSDDKKHKKKKSKKRKSDRKSDKKKKKKSKRSRRSASSSESDSAKKPSKKVDSKTTQSTALPFKWSPFAVSSERRPFDRDAEIVSPSGTMSDSAKAALMKQAHGMSSEFARSNGR